jgi:predicted Zn-dependent peptidase
MKTPLRLSLIATALAGAALTQAAIAAPPALPRELPPFGVDQPLPPTKIVRQRLPNGLEVWVVPRQGLPRVDAVLAVREAGASADGAPRAGFASLLAGLLTEGTTRRDARTLAQDLQALGGAMNASASADGITVDAQALASRAEPLLQLLAEVARQPAFADGEVKLAKANALEALKASSATPGFRAEGAIARAIYGDHAYAYSQPTAAAIEATTPAALRAAHAQRFRPDRSLLVIAGRIDAALAMKLAQAAFGDWQAQGEAAAPPPPAPLSATPVRLLLERPGSVQATLRLGRPGIAASHPDYLPLRVTSGVLGEGFSSRVNLNLREEKGYTYGASARSRAALHGGAIVGGADVRNAVTGAALKEFDAEYRRIGSEAVPAQELRETQRYMTGTFVVRNQAQGAFAATLAANWLVGQPASFLANYVQQVNRVTAAQVQAMGKKYFAPETQSIVVVGDPAAVADQLKAWGDFKRVAK